MTTSGSGWPDGARLDWARAAAASPPDQALAVLAQALQDVRATVAATSFPLDLPGVDQARRLRLRLLSRLDDYLLPRLGRLDSPLLVAVGGSTGAGKSTLINSLVRAPVSPAGPLRPTTRVPVLVCHPADTPRISELDLLSGLRRGGARERRLRLLPAPGLVAGVALVDAPDIDSVVATNRSLADEVLAAADMWLFVTTAARYADAVPWRVLREARQAGTPVAVVLDRVSASDREAVTAHLTTMLAEHGLAGAPLFVIAETDLDGQGLLAEAEVAAVKWWIDEIARNEARRVATIRRSLRGALDAVPPRARRLAAAAEVQVTASARLAQLVRGAYAAAENQVEAGLYDGTVLRGEVLGRWRDLVAHGEVNRSLSIRRRSWRGRLGESLGGGSTLDWRFQAAWGTALVASITDGAARAAQQAYTGWMADPAGRALARRDPRLGRSSPGFEDWAEHAVREWRRWVRTAVRTEAEAGGGSARRRGARVNASTLLVMVATALPDPTVVAEPDHALDAVLADPRLCEIAGHGRAELLNRVGELFVAEAARFGEPLVHAGVDSQTPARLRARAARLGQALARLPERPARQPVGRGVA